MTPKQAERLCKKITDIRRVLAAEKRKFGAFDDSKGLRYFPPKYYIQLGDYTGGMVYLRWFAKNFADDAGFPDFLFECLLILFKVGKIKEAERKALEVFCSDIHLLDLFLGVTAAPVQPWERTRHPEVAPDYITHLRQQPDLLEFTAWLTAYTTTEGFLASTSNYLDLRQQLHGEHDLEKRRVL